MRLVVALALSVSVALNAQQPAQLKLPAANASLREEFSSIVGVRELRDGRVLVSDSRETRVLVADFATNLVEKIGKAGQGPLEYIRAQQVWTVSADTGILFNLPERWVIFVGAKLVATMAPDLPAVRATRPVVRGTDTLGHVLSALGIPPPPPGGAKQVDSVGLVLVTRATARVDTLTMIHQMLPRQVGGRDANGFFTFAFPTINIAEQAAIAPDGWIAVVRVNPYRVEWRRPDGTWIRGAAIPYPKIPFSTREKQGFLDRNPGPASQPKQTPESITDWPDVLPPFSGTVPVFSTPDGRLLVGRFPSVDNPGRRYDIVNRRGVVEGQLVLPLDERIIGIGAKSVYVGFTDPDGLQFVRRHPWPPIPQK